MKLTHYPTDAVGDKIAYRYDAASNRTQIQVRDASNRVTQLSTAKYDIANRLAQAIGARGQVIAYAYDPNSNLTGVADPLSHLTAYGYDALNRLAGTVDPNGGKTGYAYDALNHLIGVTDPRNLSTGYGWDGLDDQTGVTSPDSGATTRTFDAAGNVVDSTDARGLTTVYKYDALNRPIRATYAAGKAVAWEYDQGTYGVGHLTGMTDRSGHTGWTYDQFGHVLSKSQTTAGKTFITAMSYDAAGRLATLAYPSGATVDLAYDAAGRVSGLTSGGAALVVGVGYPPFGPAESWAQGNGALYSRIFDKDGRIDSIGFGTGAIALTYDAAGRIARIGETGLAAKNFSYDALDRLTGYTTAGAALTYGYDADGNRTSLAGGGRTVAYNIDPASNRLLGSTGAGTRTLSYDAAGNVTADSQPLTVLGYAYDASGRLVQAKIGALATAYTNDGNGERVTRSGYGASSVPGHREEFVYDAAGHLLGEYDGAGKAIEETVWLGDLPVAVLMPGKSPYYVAPDHLGAPHQIADASRNTVWSWNHDPFGNGAPSGSLGYNFRFPGQYYDSETGLHYNGFRDYDPTTGRYVQSDPIGLGGGINTYAYVGANPIGQVDARGLLDITKTADAAGDYISSVVQEGAGLVVGACSKLLGEEVGFLQSLRSPLEVVTSNPQATSNAISETLNPIGYSQSIQEWYATHTTPPPEIIQGQQNGYDQFREEK